MIKFLLRAAAWALLGLIAAFTLCPIRFRPQLTGHTQIDRGLAFLLIGALVGAVYPRRRIAVGFGLLLVVVGLEIGQMFVAGRDARVHDVLVKTIGAVTGVALGAVARRLAGSAARSAGR